MRRKILVLLLALTLVLSLMPVIAFADNEAGEAASVNETTEEDKAQGEAEIDEAEANDENASIDETATNEESANDFSQRDKRTEINGESTLEGEPQQIVNVQALNASVDDEDDEDPSECTHEKTYTKEVRDRDKATYESIDNAEHKVSGPVEIITYCDDCGEKLDTEIVEKEAVEYHNYKDYKSKECLNCHNINTCEHLLSYYEYKYEKDKCKIVDCGINHEVTGTIEKVYICKTCAKIFKGEAPGNKTEQEIHYYYGGDVCVYCGHDKNRIFGKVRYDTAIGVADRYKETSGSKFENVIVADGRNFPDALSGGYLAKVKNAPILLVAPSEEDRIATYISKNIASGGTVYILGGTGVVSNAFEKKVKDKEITTERLGGETRYETNIQILETAGVKNEDILVCTGSDYADSLSASAVGKPILLVGTTLTDAQKKYIKGLSAEQFYLIGGEGAVTTTIEKDLNDLKIKPVRIAGRDRYDTSKKVAEKFFPKAETVILAYAKNFPDGLSGGPLAVLENAPIILAISGNTTAANEYVKSAGVSKNITLGGKTLISDKAVKAIMGR